MKIKTISKFFILLLCYSCSGGKDIDMNSIVNTYDCKDKYGKSVLPNGRPVMNEYTFNKCCKPYYKLDPPIEECSSSSLDASTKGALTSGKRSRKRVTNSLHRAGLQTSDNSRLGLKGPVKSESFLEGGIPSNFNTSSKGKDSKGNDNFLPDPANFVPGGYQSEGSGGVSGTSGSGISLNSVDGEPSTNKDDKSLLKSLGFESNASRYNKGSGYKGTRSRNNSKFGSGFSRSPSSDSSSKNFGSKDNLNEEDIFFDVPDTYWALIEINESIFKVISRRYEAKLAIWAKEKANKLVKSTKKKKKKNK